MIAATSVSAEVLRFDFTASSASQASCVLGDFAGSAGVVASGSITVDWDRTGSRIRVLSAGATVSGMSGGDVFVPVPIGFLGPVNARHQSMTLDLDEPSVWADLAPEGSWSLSALPLRMHALCSYQGDVQPCVQLFNTSGGHLHCALSIELGDLAPTLAEVHSAQISESEGTATLSACLRVRVPHNPSLPTLAWTMANVCFTATVATTSCASDVNADGVSDLADLLFFLSEWLPRLGGPAEGTLADFHPDGVADLVDLLDFLELWLPGCA
ncbi:MAG: hypothetical protein KF768_04595 [Phycisphaeraceae bacterium]|nr:hypothetical protein [Phycisphaeraceae bacterium]